MNGNNKQSYFLDDFLIVLVLYKTRLEDSTSFITLSEANQKTSPIDLFAYDNTPDMPQGDPFFVYKGFNIHYINDISNPGVSKAYNEGIKFARNKNKKWILFLDQDTKISKNMLSAFLESVNTEKSIKIFTTTLFTPNKELISPSLYFFKRGFKLSHVPKKTQSLKRLTPINSLLLLSVEVFDTVGMYNEKIKLDFSDHEFFDRVRKIYKTFYVINEENYHSLSTLEEVDLNNIKRRFEFFCNGANMAAGNKLLDSFQYFIVCFLRALKLGSRFKTLFFFNVLVRVWRNKTLNSL